MLVLLVSLIGASVLCVATVEARIRHTGVDAYRFLDWNLILAWTPLLLALAAYECSRHGWVYLTVPLGVLWLLFFPNAPYMLTDFIHLHQTTAPLWYDGLMISAFAWTALVLGFVSLYLMHTIWRDAIGTATGWFGVICALAVASVGVYIGRFVGYNSWDALLHPETVAHVLRQKLRNPLHNLRLEESLVVLTGFLTVAYAAFFAATNLRLSQRPNGYRGES
jgi:uncharacterized membrane protein